MKGTTYQTLLSVYNSMGNYTKARNANATGIYQPLFNPQAFIYPFISPIAHFGNPCLRQNSWCLHGVPVSLELFH